MNRIKLIFPMAFLLLSGCATTKVMDGIMSSWQGAHIDDAVSQWGYPDEEKEFRGKKLYVWHHNKSAFLPASASTTTSFIGNTAYSNSTMTGGHTISGECDRTLEVDSAGKVVSWQWGGNNCPFAEAFEYKSWRRKNT